MNFDDIDPEFWTLGATYGARILGVLLALVAAWVVGGMVRRTLLRGFEKASFDATLSKFFVRAVLEAAAAEIDGVLSETADYWDVWQRTVRATKVALDDAGVGIPFPQMDVHLDPGVRAGAAAAE